ncbi:MAG: putative ABC transporter ATP-binding protein [Chromatiales bacterium USCg_Taylor]|nr:MAG: putative ABC transporter ATP-binding protein [Chromatiales bacterium USCg_Taylor]
MFHIRYDEPGPTPRLTRGALHRAAAYFRPYWRDALWIVLCILVGALLGLIPPLLVREIIDRAIPLGDTRTLFWCVVLMIATPALVGLIGVLQNYLAVRVGQAVMFDIRNEMYEKLLAQSLRFYTNTKSGEILSRLQSDVGGIQGVVTGTLVAVVTNVLVVVTTLLVIFSINWQLSLLAIGILPIFILPTRRVGQVRKRMTRETQERVAELTALVQETLSVSGHLLVRLFGAREYEARRFREKNRQIQRLTVRQNLVGRWFFFFLLLFASVGPALIWGYGGWLAIRNALTVGTIVALVAYLSRLYGPASALVNVHVDLMTAGALFDRIFAYLDLDEEVAERPGAATLTAPRGQLQFDDVTFAYEPGKPVLSGITFEARPGELVALVGPSGSGKTTITYLASRLYDPTSGAVRIDGRGHDRQGDPGELSVPCLGAGESALRAAGRDRRPDRVGVPAGPDPRGHPVATRGLRNGGRGAGLQALGRGEAAYRDRPRDPQGSPAAHSGRSHIGARFTLRDANSGSPGRTPGRPDEPRDRSPSFDHPAGRSDPGPRSRRAGRAGQPCGASGARRDLLASLRRAVPIGQRDRCERADLRGRGTDSGRALKCDKTPAHRTAPIGIRLVAQVKVFYDQTGNTLTVWFDNPHDEYVCEETGDEVILMKDKSGRVIRR